MTQQIPATLGNITRPRLRQLLQLWQQRRGSKPMPARADFDPLQLSWMLGDLSLVDVHPEDDGGMRYRFRLVGTHVAERLGYDMTGRWLEDIPDPDYQRHVGAAFRQVIDCGLPMMERPDMRIDDRLYRYEILRLPLSNDGQSADMLMLGVDFSQS